MDDRATDEEATERAVGVWDVLWGMRTQTTHHPRWVLLVRSSSCGRARVSVYVDRRRWWIARLSMRDQGCGDEDGEGEVEGERVEESGECGVMATLGIFGIEERMVRFCGS
jgi:hypothetical protein